MTDMKTYKGVKFFEGVDTEVCEILIKLSNTDQLVQINYGVHPWEAKTSDIVYVVIDKNGVYGGLKPRKPRSPIYSPLISSIVVDGVIIYDIHNPKPMTKDDFVKGVPFRVEDSSVVFEYRNGILLRAYKDELVFHCYVNAYDLESFEANTSLFGKKTFVTVHFDTLAKLPKTL